MCCRAAHACPAHLALRPGHWVQMAPALMVNRLTRSSISSCCKVQHANLHSRGGRQHLFYRAISYGLLQDISDVVAVIADGCNIELRGPQAPVVVQPVVHIFWRVLRGSFGSEKDGQARLLLFLPFTALPPSLRHKRRDSRAGCIPAAWRPRRRPSGRVPAAAARPSST